MKKFRKVLDGLTTSSPASAGGSPSCGSAAGTPTAAPTPRELDVHETLLSEHFHICKVGDQPPTPPKNTTLAHTHHLTSVDLVFNWEARGQIRVGGRSQIFSRHIWLINRNADVERVFCRCRVRTLDFQMFVDTCSCSVSSEIKGFNRICCYGKFLDAGTLQ